MSQRDIDRERVLEWLSAAGQQFEDLDDLLRAKKLGRATIATLTQLLPSIRDPWIKECLVRILTTREARGLVGHILVQEFLAIPNDAKDSASLKWALGNALSVVATDDVFDDLVKIASETTHGKAREMVVVALGNMKNAAAPGILMDLLTDEEVVGYAAIGIAKLKHRPALTALRSLKAHRKRWVRTEIEKAIRILEKLS